MVISPLGILIREGDPVTKFPPSRMNPTQASERLVSGKAINMPSTQAQAEGSGTQTIQRRAEASGTTPQVCSVMSNPSWVAPHLRKRSTESPGRGGNEQANPNVAPRTIFFEIEVTVLQNTGTGNKGIPGRLALYELVARPIGVWELKEQLTVTRGDLRQLQEPSVAGSKVLLRRQSQNQPVRSTTVRFVSLEAAKKFAAELKQLKTNYAQSTEPVFAEKTESIPIVQDATTQAPVTEVSAVTKPVSEEIRSTAPKAEKAKEQVKLQEQEDMIDFTSTSGATMGKSTAPGRQAVNIGRKVADILIDIDTSSADKLDKYACGDLGGVPYGPPTNGAQKADAKIGRPEGIESSIAQKVVSSNNPTGQELGKNVIEAPFPSLQALQEIMARFPNVNSIKGVRLGSSVSWASTKIFLELKESNFAEVTQEYYCLSHAYSGCQKAEHGFYAVLFSLMRRNTFIQLPLDQQAWVLASVYQQVYPKDPVTSPPEELPALKSTENRCPKAVKEFNASAAAGKGRNAMNMNTQTPSYAQPSIGKPTSLDTGVQGSFTAGDWALFRCKE
ncbi:hypothetical protein GGS20DRAFT_246751 [Poronia punctata]|nr:hypothetical protein GGS20DRAFT_246751 [Poronia punctata]